MNKPFNLEAFKAGQKALTRDGQQVTFVSYSPECTLANLCVKIFNHLTLMHSDGTYHESGTESRYDLVSMVSRHQALIDSYDPEDMWQISFDKGKTWRDLDHEIKEWLDTFDYRIHPHNDLIKAYKKGAKIEKLAGEFGKGYVDDLNPTWEEYGCYRIKPELQTKTVYEWVYMLQGMKRFEFIAFADGDTIKYGEPPIFAMKTGRSWEFEYE